MRETTSTLLKNRALCVCVCLNSAAALQREHIAAVRRWHRLGHAGNADVAVPWPSVFFELQLCLTEMRVTPTPPLAPVVATPVQRELSILEIADTLRTPRRSSASTPSMKPRSPSEVQRKLLEVSPSKAAAPAPVDSATQQGTFSACPPFIFGERGGASGGGFARQNERALGPSLLELWGTSTSQLHMKVKVMAAKEDASPFTTPLAPLPLSLFFFDTASSFETFAESRVNGRLLPSVASFRPWTAGAHSLSQPRERAVPLASLPARPSYPTLPPRSGEEEEGDGAVLDHRQAKRALPLRPSVPFTAATLSSGEDDDGDDNVFRYTGERRTRTMMGEAAMLTQILTSSESDGEGEGLNSDFDDAPVPTVRRAPLPVPRGRVNSDLAGRVPTIDDGGADAGFLSDFDDEFGSAAQLGVARGDDGLGANSDFDDDDNAAGFNSPFDYDGGGTASSGPSLSRIEGVPFRSAALRRRASLSAPGLLSSPRFGVQSDVQYDSDFDSPADLSDFASTEDEEEKAENAAVVSGVGGGGGIDSDASL